MGNDAQVDGVMCNNGVQGCPVARCMMPNFDPGLNCVLSHQLKWSVAAAATLRLSQLLPPCACRSSVYARF